MAFNRNKYKAPSLATNKGVSENVQKVTKSNERKYGDFLSIDEGRNIFRLFPPHDPKDPTFQPKAVYWLTCRVPKKDSDGNIIEGEYEWRSKPIFDSRVHGGTPKDIVDEYIKCTKRTIFDENQNKEDAKKKLMPINGFRGKDGKWNRGITLSTTYIAYATKGDIKISNFGQLEIFPADKDALENLNVDDVSGDVIQTDIFSGPNAPDEENGGCKFVINLSRDEKTGKYIRTISKLEFKPERGVDMNTAWKEFNDSQRIPDDVLEHWSEMEPLAERFHNSYKRSDFNYAVEALQKFDEDNGYGTFENDEFLDVLREIDAYYPEEKASEGDDLPFENPKPAAKSQKKADPEPEVEEEEEEAPENEAPDFSSMSRVELKKFIKENDLGITVYKNMSDEALAAKVEQVWNELKELENEGEEEEESEDPTPEPEPKPEKKPSSKRKSYNSANAARGEAPSSVDAGAGPEKDDDKLPWEGEETPKPAVDRVASLRERLAQAQAKGAKK